MTPRYGRTARRLTRDPDAGTADRPLPRRVQSPAAAARFAPADSAGTCPPQAARRRRRVADLNDITVATCKAKQSKAKPCKRRCDRWRQLAVPLRPLGEEVAPNRLAPPRPRRTGTKSNNNRPFHWGGFKVGFPQGPRRVAASRRRGVAESFPSPTMVAAVPESTSASRCRTAGHDPICGAINGRPVEIHCKKPTFC